jgi:hypothetical protein
MSESTVLLRLLAALGALALGVAAAVIVGVLAHRTPGPAGATNTPAPSSAPSSTTPNAGAGTPSFPAPPKGAVVFSRPDGSDVLALAVVPGRTLGLQASVLNSQRKGVDGLKVSFRVGSHVAAAKPCGAGCYRATAASRGAPEAVDVQVVGGKTTTWHVRMPRPWPPPDGSALVARATHAYRKLRTLTIQDRLSSGPGQVVNTRWTLAAPNRLTYQIVNGPAAVIIGARRWDKVPGGKWQESAQTPIRQPTPFWVSWTDAHVVESTQSASRVSFFDPKTPAWFELLIAKRSMRTLDLRMNTTAHFMHEVYGGFDEPLNIKPPS